MKSRDDRPRAWNSTLKIGRKPLERTPFKGPVGPTRKPRKAMPKANPERQRKAAKRYAIKLAKYRASETYRVVEARAAGQCEAEWDAFYIANGYIKERCTATEGLEHHHKTYARFGGRELPEDIDVLCKVHHEYVESLKAAGNRRSRNRGAA